MNLVAHIMLHDGLDFETFKLLSDKLKDEHLIAASNQLLDNYYNNEQGSLERLQATEVMTIQQRFQKLHKVLKDRKIANAELAKIDNIIINCNKIMPTKNNDPSAGLAWLIGPLLLRKAPVSSTPIRKVDPRMLQRELAPRISTFFNNTNNGERS